MRCLHCGYCCKNYMVAVIDDITKPIDKTNIVFHKGDGSPCKHLKGDRPGKYKCSVHNLPFYKDTPCFAFGQIERSPNEKCRMGVYIMKKYKEQIRIK